MPTTVKKLRVIVTRRLPDVVETRMRELFDAQLNTEDRLLTQAELIEAAKTTSTWIPRATGASSSPTRRVC